MQVAKNVDLVHYRNLGNGDLQIQVAVKGSLAPMIDDHVSSRERYSSDEEYFAWIGRQSEALIHVLGDARNPLPMALSLTKQQEGF